MKKLLGITFAAIFYVIAIILLTPLTLGALFGTFSHKCVCYSKGEHTYPIFRLFTDTLFTDIRCSTCDHKPNEKELLHIAEQYQRIVEIRKELTKTTEEKVAETLIEESKQFDDTGEV